MRKKRVFLAFEDDKSLFALFYEVNAHDESGRPVALPALDFPLAHIGNHELVSATAGIEHLFRLVVSLVRTAGRDMDNLLVGRAFISDAPDRITLPIVERALVRLV